MTQLTDKQDVHALRMASPDHKESFEIGNEQDSKYQNRWPKQQPKLKETMLGFFDECQELHMRVMSSIALGLGLPKAFFNEYCDQGDNNLRLLHYPSIPRSLLDRKDQSRAGYSNLNTERIAITAL